MSHINLRIQVVLITLLSVTSLAEPVNAADCWTVGRAEQSETQKIDIYLDMIEQWKKGNVNGLVAHMTKDVVWNTAAGIAPPLVGKKNVRAWLQKYAGTVQNSRWRVVAYSESANQLFVEGVEDNEMPNGHRVAIPYAGVYDFRGDKMCGGRDYFDRGLVDRLKAGEPTPDYVDALNTRDPISRSVK